MNFSDHSFSICLPTDCRSYKKETLRFWCRGKTITSPDNILIGQTLMVASLPSQRRDGLEQYSSDRGFHQKVLQSRWCLQEAYHGTLTQLACHCQIPHTKLPSWESLQSFLFLSRKKYHSTIILQQRQTNYEVTASRRREKWTSSSRQPPTT